MKAGQSPEVAVEPVSGPQFSYYRAIILLLAVVLGILLFFYYLINRPPTAVDKKPLLGYSHLFSIYGHRADRLARPTEVAVDRNQNIYVADTNNHRIVVFDAEGGYVSQFGDAGDHRGQIKQPSAIAVDDKNNAYVLSRTQNKMIIYNGRRKVTWEVSVESPLAVTVKGDRIYLATERGVMVGSTKGELLTSFGRRGAKRGDVDHPTGIVVDDKQHIYVADSLNYRVQAFNTDGKSLWVAGRRPQYRGEIKDKSRTFGLPAGLTMGDDGNLYMVDAQGGEIVVLNTEGRELKRFGDWGHDDGQFYYPAGIAYMGGNKFAIADKFNDRVQVIRYGRPRLTESVPGGLPVTLLLLLIAGTAGTLAGRWIWQTRLLRQRQAELDGGASESAS